MNLIRNGFEIPEERAAFECGYRLGRLHGEPPEEMQSELFERDRL